MKVGFFSDSKIAIEVVKSLKNNPPWEIYAPVQKIRDRSNDFILALFVTISRSLNTRAHNVAKSCLRSGNDFMDFSCDVTDSLQLKK